MERRPSTCRRHYIDPQLYLTQLLTNLPVLQASQLPQWLPDQWKINHTAHGHHAEPGTAHQIEDGIQVALTLLPARYRLSYSSAAE
jgi:hypothetical protein